MPKVQQEFFALQGGLDQLTPAIALEPGFLFDCQNYEPEISGGYRRIDGFERYDGRVDSPTSAFYYQIAITQTATIFSGQTITGLASGASAKVLAVVGSVLVLSSKNFTGNLIAGEALQISSVTVATSLTAPASISEPDASKDADYMLLAANDYRSYIQPVPGSGPIRGVWVYRDVVYVFRDNVGGTAGTMWKATGAGWSQVTFGNQLTFGTGLVAPTVGQTIKGATSGATGVVVAVLLRTGGWGSAGAGSIVYSVTSGTFANGELIKDNALAVTYCTATSAGAAIVRAPGGTMEFVNANFTGSTDTLKMYGVDGVNPCFEFDGTNYVPIYTGMASETPSHIMFHRYYLFLSFKGSVQFSGLGTPYAWSVILGAGEIGVGDDVTGFVPQGGNNAGSSMAIFTKSRVYILYGSSSANFNLVLSIFDIGYFAGTIQPVSNTTYGMTPRGIQSLITTLTYGDFDFSSISHKVNTFITSKRGLAISSTSSRIKDQFRVYFSDGTALVMGLTGDQVNGLMPLNYGKAVRSIVTAQLTNGTEATYFGSDDGYVYRDNIGTSFDGNAIEAWIRPCFNHSKSPRIRKRYRRAVFEVKATGFSKVNIGYDLGYGNPDVLPPDTIINNNVLSGGFWDQLTWDNFTWDGKIVSDISMPLTGTEKNISFLFYSSRAQDKSHTVQGITLFFSPQRAER